ncbi:hypothetical protein GCM10018781_02150 [Kitasatospora indigofera]|uniref:Uncharacterized protein n=1 Tax=Kitasatospora indigofera TaxID=67307 RepID=A0A919KK96_9ACTN|nr:hypothetical protein GCM10018781_02150 [Kitasatospora indigofera]
MFGWACDERRHRFDGGRRQDGQSLGMLSPRGPGNDRPASVGLGSGDPGGAPASPSILELFERKIEHHGGDTPACS